MSWKRVDSLKSIDAGLYIVAGACSLNCQQICYEVILVDEGEPIDLLELSSEGVIWIKQVERVYYGSISGEC